MGTVVHQGSGRGVAVATGSATAFGKIAVGLAERQPETAFQAGLRGFSKLLVRVAAVLTGSIFVINVALSRPLLEALLFSLAIAIGITPQLLPAIVSVSLSTGSRQLARRRVLVKRLVTIEDLGNIEVLFTDKTGTLTQGAITFDQALDPAGQPARWPLLLGLVCNEATITEHGPVGGNALDVALWSAPAAQPLAADRAGGPSAYQRLGLAPFDHDRQLASVAVRTPTGATLLVTKGAPEAVLARCAEVPADAQATLARLFADGARVIAVATRDAPGLTTPSAADEHGLHLDGFLTFIDRPKADAGTSIAKLGALGITVKVITGDNPIVAARSAATSAWTSSRSTPAPSWNGSTTTPSPPRSATPPCSPGSAPTRNPGSSRSPAAAAPTSPSSAMASTTRSPCTPPTSASRSSRPPTWPRTPPTSCCWTRTSAYSPTASMEGRRIFANTLKYVLMATSSNFGNMFSAAGASLFLSFLPMLPSQILLNNLLYDAGQLAIPSDRVDPETLARPAAWDIGFVRRFMSVFGPISSIFDFLTFVVMLRVLHASHAEFRSGWFVESLATQTLVVFVIRTRRVPFFHSRPSLPMLLTPPTCALIGAALPFTPLAGFLGFATLPVSFFLILLGMIATYLLLVEIAKRRFTPSKLTPAGCGQPSRNATSGASNGAPPASPTTPPHDHRVDDIDRGPARRTRIRPATAST
jgi:Mg2+-importing ATPase